MSKFLAAFATIALFVIATPTLALADHEGRDHGGNPDHGAPEPLTVLGLAAGAGGIAFARWAKNRKR